MERSQLAIVIPAYNEAATIAKIVNTASKYGQAIVVDDCSKDATAVLAKEAGAMVVQHALNQGYDGALNSGFKAADQQGYVYVITFDADGQHHEDLLQVFLAHLEQGYDLVLGVRPFYARLAERLFGIYARLRFGFQDPLCGMKGYRIEIYREHGCFDSYRSIGTELALYGLLSKKRFIQVSVPIAARDGAPRFGQMWKANYKIMRAMWMSFFKL